MSALVGLTDGNSPRVVEDTEADVVQSFFAQHVEENTTLGYIGRKDKTDRQRYRTDR